MILPIDVLSQMMTRTGSGMGARHKVDSGFADGLRFDMILSETRMETEPLITDNSEPEKAEETEEIVPEKPKKNGEDNVEVTLAAGVVGEQNNVVIILEGDKESGTDPEIQVDAVPVSAVNCAETGEYQANASDVKPETAAPDEIYAEEQDAEETAADISETPVPVEQAGSEAEAAALYTVKTEEKTDTAATDTNEETSDISGEVTARTPAIRTSERSDTENEGNNTDFSKDGDLSPLENENDTVSVKGQKEKKSPETEDSVRIAAKSTEEPVNNVSAPVTEDIKPERFRAEQQMKRAADAPVRAENLFEEMVARVETMKSESVRSMTIQLKPEFLGEVALEIALDAAGLHVKISAADSDVRSMVNGQIDALIETLGNKGIEVAEVEVAYTGVNNGAFADSREGQAQPDKPRRSYRTDKIGADELSYFAALPLGMLENYLDSGVSSVEYRA